MRDAEHQSNQEPLLHGERRGAYAGREERVSRKGRAAQVTRAVLNLINSGTGTSTVSMPKVVRTLGVGVALLAAALQSALGIASNHIISRESDQENAGSYCDLMHAINSLGKLVVWLIILADVIVGTPGQLDGLLPEMFHFGAEAKGRWYLLRAPWIAALVVLALPAISVRSLDKLAGISFFGDLACLFISSTGVGLWVSAVRQGKAHPLHWVPSREEAGSGSIGRLALDVGSALPVLMGAAFTQNNINSVMSQVRPYRQTPLDVASASARLATMALFMALGISNCGVFGTDLKPDILSNYNRPGLEAVVHPRAAAWLSGAAKGAFLVNGLVSLPMYLQPFQKNLWDALPNQDSQERMADRKSFVLTNYISIAACAAVAMLVPDVWKPLKLLGATAVSSMAFTFPGLIHLMAHRRGGGVPAREVALAWVLLVVGVLQLGFGVVAQFV